MRDVELGKEAIVEDRAMACRSGLLQLSIEGFVEEDSVGP